MGQIRSPQGGIEAAISAAEDELRRAAALDKWCRSAEESISNLKFRAEVEGGVLLNGLREAPQEGGGWVETCRQWGVPSIGCSPGAISSSGVRRDGNASDFSLILPPGVDISVFWGVACI